MMCQECFKNLAHVKMAQISIEYEYTAIEIVCDNVCIKCLCKAINRKSTLFKSNPTREVKVN